MSARLPRWLRPLVSLVVLGALAVWLDPIEIGSRLVRLDPAWALGALLVSVGQVAASAWRWRFTAERLGLELPFEVALAEYYRAGFLNQILPGGVLGDVSRAWRHGRPETGGGLPDGRAVRAVVLERGSGQVVMAVVALASLPWIPGWAGMGIGLLMAALAFFAAGAWFLRGTVADRTDAARGWWRGVGDEIRISLLARNAWPRQLASSTLVVSTYLAMYLCAARSVGVHEPWQSILPLVAPVLLAMLVPVTVAGWGLREGAAAVIWQAAGLPAVDGVAISVAYGLLVLISTLPGAYFAVAATSPHTAP